MSIFLLAFFTSLSSFATDVSINAPLNLSACGGAYSATVDINGSTGVYDPGAAGGIGGLASGYPAGGFPALGYPASGSPAGGAYPGVGAFPAGGAQPRGSQVRNSGIAAGPNAPNDNELSAAPVRGCPFMAEQAGPASDIAQIQGYIHELSAKEANNQDGCSAVRTAAQTAEQTMSNTLRDNLLLQYPTTQGGGIPTCQNYEAVLLSEKSFASNGSGSSYGPYSQCYGTSINSADCVQHIYTERVSCAARMCRDNVEAYRTNTRNQAARDALLSLATNAEALIESSGNCSNEAILGSVLKNSIATLSTLGSLAASDPISGTAVALTGRLLNALVNRFLSKNDARVAWAKLVKENEMQKMQCMYMLSLRNSLSCDQLLLENLDLTPVDAQRCMQYADPSQRTLASNLSVLDDITSALAAQSSTDPESSQTTIDRTTATRAIDSLNQVLETKIGEQSYEDYIRGLSAKLRDKAKEPGAKRLRLLELASGIDSFLSNHQKVNEMVASGALDAPTIDGLGQSILKTLTSGETLAATIRTAMSELSLREFNGVDSLSTFIEASKATDRASSQITATLSEIRGAASRDSDGAHDALLRVIQGQFDQRLSQVGWTFAGNTAFQDDSDTRNDAEYLLASCTLNAGAFYFDLKGNANIKARNKIKDPGKVYKAACEPVFCSGVAPRPPANPDPLSFRRYQCSVISHFNDYRQRLFQNPRLHCGGATNAAH